MNTEFTMIGFKNYSDKELAEIENQRTPRLGYSNSNYQPYTQPEPSRSMESDQKDLQKEVADKMNANSNHIYYWERWAINTGARNHSTSAETIDNRISQRQAIIDYLSELGANPERFNNVSLEDLRKMANRAGA